MCQTLFQEAVSSLSQPYEVGIIIASCFRWGSCNSGRWKNCPRTPEPEAAELQQPNSEAWPLHSERRIRSCILLPECGLSFFQKPLLHLSEDLKYRAIYCQIGLPGADEICPTAARNPCLCIGRWKQVSAPWRILLPEILLLSSVPWVTLAQCWHIVAPQEHWLNRTVEKSTFVMLTGGPLGYSSWPLIFDHQGAHFCP